MTSGFSTDSERLEAFSDGVIAVIITLMVLDLRPPHGAGLPDLRAVLPTFAAYVLSFIFIGIYWNNHHHMLRATSGIDGRSMWANLHLLFWLSLAPFTTSWLGEHPLAAAPTALYGLVLFIDAIAYVLLQNALLRVNGEGTDFARAVQSDLKSKISPLIYVLGIGLAFVWPPIADVLYIAVAVIWIVPERRFEPVITKRHG
jgi:uncharacterized membrane protein